MNCSQKRMRWTPDLKALDDEALCQRPPRVQAQVQAWRYRDTLCRLDFAPIISGSHNDDPAWKVWTDAHAQTQRIDRFKKPLLHADPTKADPLAFLIVKSMLLTGFDAQIEGVMYLDRPIREAELLQTIARVNRTGHGKKVGIVVDYFGLAHHLKDALKVYADEDIDGALQSLQDEVPVLRDQHLRVTDLLRRRGIDDLDDHEACVTVLADERPARRVHGQAQGLPRHAERGAAAPGGAALRGRCQAPRLHPRPRPATATATPRCWARTWAPRCAS